LPESHGIRPEIVLVLAVFAHPLAWWQVRRLGLSSWLYRSGCLNTATHFSDEDLVFGRTQFNVFVVIDIPTKRICPYFSQFLIDSFNLEYAFLGVRPAFETCPHPPNE